MRSLLALTLSLALLPSCASTGKGSGGGDDAPAATGGEGECLRRVAAANKHFCEDRPSELSEGYAMRARGAWHKIAKDCTGTRASRALREFDRCIAEFEAQPSQIDDATRARREDARSKVTELKADVMFSRALAKKRAKVSEADDAHREFMSARESGDKNEMRFRKEAWDLAERELRAAEQELRDALRIHNLDPRDARALGVW